MSDTTAVVQYAPNNQSVAVANALTASDLVAQVHLIQDVMRAVMKEGEHYGKIPGCGEKPTLLKPGSEKLAMTFRLAPRFDITAKELPGGHREYTVRVTLETIGSGSFVGEGVGSCSTMESKYRYRTGPVEFTGKPVPKEYWDIRKENPAKAIELIGGKGHSTKKNPDTGIWEIAIQGEKVEHDNPADHYNTALKMAKKRALVDAVLTATAASDIFTQDVEDLVDNGVIVNATSQPSKPAASAERPAPTYQRPPVAQVNAPHPADHTDLFPEDGPPPDWTPEQHKARQKQLSDQQQQPPADPPRANPANAEKPISDAQAKRLFAIAKEHGWDNDELREFVTTCGYEHSKDILRKDYDGIIEVIIGRQRDDRV